MFRKLLNRYRRGREYVGVVAYSDDPLLVPWPGHYIVNENGEIDKHGRLEFEGFDRVDGVQRWKRA